MSLNFEPGKKFKESQKYVRWYALAGKQRVPFRVIVCPNFMARAVAIKCALRDDMHKLLAGHCVLTATACAVEYAQETTVARPDDTVLAARATQMRKMQRLSECSGGHSWMDCVKRLVEEHPREFCVATQCKPLVGWLRARADPTLVISINEGLRVPVAYPPCSIWVSCAKRNESMAARKAAASDVKAVKSHERMTVAEILASVQNDQVEEEEDEETRVQKEASKRERKIKRERALKKKRRKKRKSAANKST